jgi:hypothetical protein
VRKRHSAGSDAATKAIPHNQIETGAELFDERHQRQEVITVIGIAHDNELASSRLDASRESGSVASDRNANEPSPELLNEFGRAVGAAIIGDDNFTYNLMSTKELLGLPDTDSNRPYLVEAWHENGELYLHDNDATQRPRAALNFPAASFVFISGSADQITVRTVREPAQLIQTNDCGPHQGIPGTA